MISMPSTFIILDVDKFKEVNDHYGHAVGDIVLSTLGQTLRNYFRENDIIGRIGGDEFVIYMCKTERQRWIFSVIICTSFIHALYV